MNTNPNHPKRKQSTMMRFTTYTSAPLRGSPSTTTHVGVHGSGHIYILVDSTATTSDEAPCSAELRVTIHLGHVTLDWIRVQGSWLEVYMDGEQTRASQSDVRLCTEVVESFMALQNAEQECSPFE